MRDIRLDFFRGLAIYMILVDHVSGDPLAKFTYQVIGFSDSAEIFVFISGVTCGIAYYRKFAKQGLQGLSYALARRAVRIYAYYVLSSVAMILLVALAAKYIRFDELLGINSATPLASIGSALLLTKPAPFSEILILYIILTCFVVPPLVIASDRSRVLLLSASGLVWLSAQVYAGHTLDPVDVLFVNPFAWQFLFAIGVMVGISRERESTMLNRLLDLRWAKAVAWAIVLAAFAVRILSSRTGFNISGFNVWAYAVKKDLSILRLVHFLSVAYLVGSYFARRTPFLQLRLTSAVITMGVHSLEVFSLSAVLTIALNLIALTHVPSLTEWLALDAIVFGMLALTAASLTLRRTLLRPEP